MIPVQVTQTQEENDNPTMAPPVWDTFLVPQIPKKLLQSKLWAKKEDASVPEPGFIQVPSHIRGSSKVQGYKKHTTPAKSNGNKKKDKAVKSKTKARQSKLPVFSKAKADSKETLQLANTLRIKYLKELVHSF